MGSVAMRGSVSVVEVNFFLAYFCQGREGGYCESNIHLLF